MEDVVSVKLADCFKCCKAQLHERKHLRNNSKKWTLSRLFRFKVVSYWPPCWHSPLYETLFRRILGIVKQMKGPTSQTPKASSITRIIRVLPTSCCRLIYYIFSVIKKYTTYWGSLQHEIEWGKITRVASDFIFYRVL